MDKIYLHIPQQLAIIKKEPRGNLFGLKGAKLFSLSIREIVENKFIHHFLEVGELYCEVKPSDTPFDALYSYGKIYSGYPSLKHHAQFVEIS